MLKKRIITFICLFILCFQGLGNKDQTGESKSILILFSLRPTAPAYMVILENIRNKLNQAFGDNYNLHIEYLETDMFPQGEYPKEKFGPFNSKYREVKLDLLICVGINIIPILKTNAESYLLNLPTISLDLDFSNYGIEWDKSLNDNTLAISLKIEAGQTISAILKLLPETTSIYFICGSSYGDQLFCKASEIEAKKIEKDYDIKFITNASMDEILRSVRKLPDRSIIIIPSFNSDSKKVPYNNPESVRLISKTTNSPVFTYSTIGFGEGAVGGYLISFSKAGQIAGEAANKILNGTHPKSLKFQESDYYELLYDWRQLKRWNIADSDKIPENSAILFEDHGILEKNRWLIIGGVLFILFQTILIIRLVSLNRKQVLMTRQIRETENRYRELVHEDRIMRIGQLTASLSHELNQPLTSILSTAQAGVRFIDSNKYTPELLREILQNIVEDDKRTASILSSIRGMMKLETREKEITELKSMIHEVVAIYQSELMKLKSELFIKFPEFPIYIYADRIQIQQVILNFISNALQSIEKSGTQNKTITITGISDHEQVTVSVRDFGEGIDESVRDVMFKPFVTSKSKGLGIGLSISSSIIEGHEGKIWAENKSDGGAEFCFSLKIHKDGH